MLWWSQSQWMTNGFKHRIELIVKWNKLLLLTLNSTFKYERTFQRSDALNLSICFSCSFIYFIYFFQHCIHSISQNVLYSFSLFNIILFFFPIFIDFFLLKLFFCGIGMYKRIYGLVLWLKAAAENSVLRMIHDFPFWRTHVMPFKSFVFGVLVYLCAEHLNNRKKLIINTWNIQFLPNGM